jgi:hypothetical protein
MLERQQPPVQQLQPPVQPASYTAALVMANAAAAAPLRAEAAAVRAHPLLGLPVGPPLSSPSLLPGSHLTSHRESLCNADVKPFRAASAF